MPDKTYLVARFQQGEALERCFPNMAIDATIYSDREAMFGICYGLSLNWLRRVVYFRDEGPYNRIATIGNVDSIVYSTQAQMFYSMDVHARNAIIESGEPWVTRNIHQRILNMESRNFYRMIRLFDFTKLTEIFGSSISRNSFRILLGSINLEECARALASRITAPLTHHLILLDITRNSGEAANHVVACSMSGRILLYFDSNAGEAHVPEADVQKFLSTTLSRLEGGDYKFSALQVLRVS